MRRGLKGLIAATGTAAVGILLVLTPLGTNFEQNVGLSWLFKLRGSIPAPNGVVVAAIDDQTGSHLGLSKLPREWPRSVHGRLVENLARRGASAIVFDLDFQLPKQAEADEAFAQSVANSGRVILVEKLDGKRQPLITSSGKRTGSVWVEHLVPPIPALATVAKGLGPFPVPKTQVAIHQFWAFKRSVGVPTMPSVALQIHALSAYPYLKQLIEKTGGTASQPLESSVRAREVQKFMRSLRLVFSKNPKLGGMLKAMLANKNLDVPSDKIPLLQALIGLYEGEDHRYLNFYGPPGSIATIPYHLLADDPNVDPGANLPDLTGKVVFVGFSDLYDPGQPDRFYTVFTNEDGVDLSGIEIAATAYANLLTNSCLRTLGMAGEILIVAAFGGIIAAIAYLLPAIAGVPLTLILAGGYFAGILRSFIVANVWLPLAIPLLVQLPLALFVGLLTQYFLERKKKTKAIQAIGLYLPENIVRNFTEGNLDDSALNRVSYCVCFASDVAGFTGIAEKLNPKELAAFLNDYFETLSKPLRHHGVDVVEFRADGIMCAWTAEQPDPDIRRKALLAGLEAIAAIAHFKASHPQFPQSLRIGLEDGMAYIGHAGGGGHFVYSIVGDCANTAARIEGLNKQLNTQLLVSRSVLDGVQGLLYRSLGEFCFVGKSESLEVLEVLAFENTANESQRILCKNFLFAIELLRSGDWHRAEDAFEAILKDYPDDGPSLFHLARCKRFVDFAPEEPPWLIRMDAK